MQSTHTLSVLRRERLGSRYAARERAAGRLPCVVYGHGEEPAHLSLNAKEAIRFFRSGERVFTISLEGESKSQTVLLKDLQYDYLGDGIIHADLARVDLNEVVESHPPIEFTGDAAGLKRSGAILMHPLSTLGIRCTVAAIPESIEIDISSLDVGEALHAKDVSLPDGMELTEDPQAIVASISITKVVEEDEGTEAAAVSAESAEPERIGGDADKDAEKKGD